MALHKAVCALALVALAAGFQEGVWGPADSAKALDTVISAVDRIASNPHLTPELLKKAKLVAMDIKNNIQEVENDKKLTKEEAHERVGASIKELLDLKGQLGTMANSTETLQGRMAALKKQLAMKKAELAKDENMIKLLNLQKELAKKKMQLQKLLEQKGLAEGSKADAQKEAAQESALASSLLLAAKDFSGAAAKSALASVKASEKALTDNLGKLAAVGKVNGVSRSMKKTQALKKAELKELRDAEKSLEKKDPAGLKKAVNRLQAQAKALQAKTGNFLH